MDSRTDILSPAPILLRDDLKSRVARVTDVKQLHDFLMVAALEANISDLSTRKFQAQLALNQLEKLYKFERDADRNEIITLQDPLPSDAAKYFAYLNFCLKDFCKQQNLDVNDLNAVITEIGTDLHIKSAQQIPAQADELGDIIEPLNPVKPDEIAGNLIFSRSMFSPRQSTEKMIHEKHCPLIQVLYEQTYNATHSEEYYKTKIQLDKYEAKANEMEQNLYRYIQTLQDEIIELKSDDREAVKQQKELEDKIQLAYYHLYLLNEAQKQLQKVRDSHGPEGLLIHGMIKESGAPTPADTAVAFGQENIYFQKSQITSWEALKGNVIENEIKFIATDSLTKNILTKSVQVETHIIQTETTFGFKFGFSGDVLELCNAPRSKGLPNIGIMDFAMLVIDKNFPNLSPYSDPVRINMDEIFKELLEAALSDERLETLIQSEQEKYLKKHLGKTVTNEQLEEVKKNTVNKITIDCAQLAYQMTEAFALICEFKKRPYHIVPPAAHVNITDPTKLPDNLYGIAEKLKLGPSPFKSERAIKKQVDQLKKHYEPLGLKPFDRENKKIPVGSGFSAETIEKAKENINRFRPN